MANASGQIHLISFGASASRYYQFKNVSRASTNFGRNDTRVTRVIGMDGGIDEFRRGAAPRSIGSVTVSFYLVADRREDMTALRDAAAGIISWGMQPLIAAPFDPTYAARFCWARCTNVDMPEDAGVSTEYLQQVDMTFEVADPRWYSNPSLFWIGQDDVVIGAVETYVGYERYDALMPTGNTTQSFIYTGKVPTPVTILVDNIGPAVASSGPFTISHEDEFGNVLNSFTWADTMDISGQFTMDASRLLYKHSDGMGDHPAWDAITITVGSGFFWFLPGTNVLRFNGTFAGSHVYVYYDDAWG